MSYVHLDLPTSTQYVTFPTEQNQPVLIAWSEGRVPQTATYYVTKCYWGNVSPAPEPEVAASRHPQPDVMVDPSRTLNVLGETRLYIAAELIEPHYAGGVLADYHIRDLATSRESHVSSWITMRLNACFHYGQNKISDKKVKRWIVYHPPIARGILAPNMFQHRFTNLPSIEFAKLGLGALGEQMPEDYNSVVTGFTSFGSLGLELVKSVVGDPLHRFLDPLGVEAARQLQANVTSLGGTRGQTEEDAEDRRITALQLIEASGAEEDNKEENVLKELRARQAVEFLEEMKTHREQKISWWQDIFSPLSPFKTATKRDVIIHLKTPAPTEFASVDHKTTQSYLANATKADDGAVKDIIWKVRADGVPKLVALEKEAAAASAKRNSKLLDRVTAPPHGGGLPGPVGGTSLYNAVVDNRPIPEKPRDISRQYNSGRRPF